MGTPPDKSRSTQTNPLGGRIHGISTIRPLRRTWAEFADLVRKCPECGWENDDHAEFCVNCTAAIGSVPPIPADSQPSRTSANQKRRTRDQSEQLLTRRPDTSRSGGFLAIGAVILLVAILLETEPILRLSAWGVAIAFAIAGIWHIRANEVALRRWGMVLTGCTVVAIIATSWQARAFNDDSIRQIGTPVATENPLTSLGTPSGSGASGITDVIPMAGGNPEHTNLLAGSLPEVVPVSAWQFDTIGEVNGPAVLEAGILYVTSKDGMLYAIEAATGTHLWQRSVSTYAVRASPAVVDGVVYVGAGFAFLALDARTGEEVWSAPLSYVGHASPTVVDSLVIVPSQQGWMFALDRATGTTRWRVPTEGVVFGAASVTGKHLVYGTDNGVLYDANLDTGRVLWRKRLSGPIYPSPIILGSKVIVTSEVGVTAAYDLDTGDDLWSFQHGGRDAMAASETLLVLPASDGGVYGLDPATGEQKWLYPSGKRSLTSVAIVGNSVLFGAGDSIFALDTETGTARWYYLAGDVIVSSPIAANGVIFFGSLDGFYVALRPS